MELSWLICQKSCYVGVYFWVIHSIPLLYLVIFMPTLKGQHWKDWYLKLQFQYSGHLRQRSHSLERTLMLGKIESRRWRGQQRMRWLDGVTESIDMNLSKLQEIVKDRETWCVSVHGVPKSQTRFGNWRKKRNAAKLDLFSKFQLFNFTF